MHFNLNKHLTFQSELNQQIFLSFDQTFYLMHSKLTKVFDSELKVRRPDAVTALGEELTAVGPKFRVRIIVALMRSVLVRLDLVWQRKYRSKDLQQERRLLTVLILLAGFAKRSEHASSSILTSPVMRDNKNLLFLTLPRSARGKKTLSSHIVTL